MAKQKSNALEAQLNKLKQEIEILRDAATYDAETIRKLKQEVRELRAGAPGVATKVVADTAVSKGFTRVM